MLLMWQQPSLNRDRDRVHKFTSRVDASLQCILTQITADLCWEHLPSCNLLYPAQPHTRIPSSEYLVPYTAAHQPCAAVLSDCRGAHVSKVSGMTPTMFGKVVEAASLKRKLPKSFLQTHQVWRSSALPSPMTASLQHLLEQALSHQTSGAQLPEAHQSYHELPGSSISQDASLLLTHDLQQCVIARMSVRLILL